MKREVRLTYVLLPVLWLVAVPVAAYFDALLTVTPATSEMTTIAVESPNPGFWDFFWLFVRINSWEMLLLTSGVIIGVLTWERKIRF